MPGKIQETVLRRYLLGELTEEEREGVELQYLADEAVYQDLVAAENDLIHDYVRDELTREHRLNFEREYLTSPERSERVEFARALDRLSASERDAVGVPSASPWEAASPWKALRAAISARRAVPAWALVAACAIVVVLGSWLTMRMHTLSLGLRQARAAQVDLRRESDSLRQRIAELQNAPEGRARQNQERPEVAQLETPGPVAAVTLAPAERSVGAQEQVLDIPPKASQVRLQLVLENNEYSSYVPRLTTVDGKEVLQGGTLRARSTQGGPVVVWTFAPDLLDSGDYIVQLKGRVPGGGTEDLPSYTFRVLRR